MTLIAAYRPYGIPVLFGDFLISGGIEKSTNKKIYKVSRNFVVGWTGKKIDASRLLRGIFNEFADRIVTISEVEQFLTKIPQDKDFLEELHLIGWVVENDIPSCFLWNIQYPTELFCEPYHLDGSGSEKFSQLIKQDVAKSPIELVESATNQAIYSVLIKAAELYSDEGMQRINQSNNFGHGYELLYFNGKEFQYLDNIAFSGFDIFWNVAEEKGLTIPHKFWYRYGNFGSQSTFLIHNLHDGNIFVELIYPLVKAKEPEASIEWSVDSFRADYYSLYFRIQTDTNENYSISVVIPEIKVGPSKYEQFKDGRNGFVFGKEFIKRVYQNAKFRKEYYERQSVPIGWGAGTSDQVISKSNSRIVFQTGQTDKIVVVGFLKDEAWDQNHTSIDYALMCFKDETIKIYEKGNVVGPLGVKYVTSDYLSLEVKEFEGKLKVNYLKDNVLLYQSNVEPILPLKIVIALEEGALLINPRMTKHNQN